MVLCHQKCVRLPSYAFMVWAMDDLTVHFRLRPNQEGPRILTSEGTMNPVIKQVMQTWTTWRNISTRFQSIKVTIPDLIIPTGTIWVRVSLLPWCTLFTKRNVLKMVWILWVTGFIEKSLKRSLTCHLGGEICHTHIHAQHTCLAHSCTCIRTHMCTHACTHTHTHIHIHVHALHTLVHVHARLHIITRSHLHLLSHFQT